MNCVIGGVKFDNVTMAEAVTAIVAMARKAEHPCLICTANLDHLATIQKDDAFRKVYDEADFVVADGMPLVWLSRLAGTPLKERVAGSDMLWEISRASHQTGIRLFFLGGQPGSADNAAAMIRKRYPCVEIVGTYCPPFGSLNDPEEDQKIYKMVAAAEPDVLLVGLGSPKQEKWIATHRKLLRVPVSIGVGGSFEMAAGVVSRAPIWMQKIGCEWLYRFVQEPKRLYDRYIKRDLPFLVRIAWQIMMERLTAPPLEPKEIEDAAAAQ